MKTIMVDMDNVITDGVFKEYIEEFYSKKIDLEEIKVYDYVQNITNNNREEFWKAMIDKNFYDKAPLLEGCYEVLKKLNEKYNIFIVTSYLWNETIDLSGKNLQNKYYYLREMLPFIGPEKYIFTTDKSLLKFDIRIDDRINNLEGASLKILFSAWHNRDITDMELSKKNIIRVNNWYDILRILETDKI